MSWMYKNMFTIAFQLPLAHPPKTYLSPWMTYTYSKKQMSKYDICVVSC